MSRLTGKALATQNGIKAAHVLYRLTGDWFHLPTGYPAALLDQYGYISFMSSTEYEEFIEQGRGTGIKQSLDTNTLTIKGGISSHRLYVPFASAMFPNEIVDPKTVVEGARRQVTVNSYERDNSARRLCIEKWGVNCAVCEINFEKAYGPIGKGFIHVHHLTPISSIKMEYVLTPQRDMRPVCPNCHAMLHRQEPPLSIDELRGIVVSKCNL